LALPPKGTRLLLNFVAICSMPYGLLVLDVNDEYRDRTLGSYSKLNSNK
jgi:hypothetical protein